MSRWNLLLTVLFCLGLVPLAAAPPDVPGKLMVDPSVVKEGAQSVTVIQTVVVLRAPAKDYFICEVRSPDRRRIDTTSIIIKKGDKGGVGKAFINWKHVPLDTKIRLTAFNVQQPLNFAFCIVTLKKKPMETDKD